jgi:hypothetical protein
LRTHRRSSFNAAKKEYLVVLMKVLAKLGTCLFKCTAIR